MSEDNNSNLALNNGRNFYFKLILTTLNFQIYLNYNTKLSELRQYINNIVLDTFNLIDYEIVLVGQELAEYSQKLDESNQLDFISYFNEDIKYTAFYIRPIFNTIESIEQDYQNRIRSINNNQIFTRLLSLVSITNNLTNNFTNNLTNNLTNNFQCPICFDYNTIANSRNLQCAHRFCIDCINLWINSTEQNIYRDCCPLCRNRIV